MFSSEHIVDMTVMKRKLPSSRNKCVLSTFFIHMYNIYTPFVQIHSLMKDLGTAIR